MKYIIFNSPTVGDFPIVFPTYIDHSKMERAITNEYPDVKSVRGGLVEMENISILCYSEFEDIGLVSGGDKDNQLIKNLLA